MSGRGAKEILPLCKQIRVWLLMGPETYEHWKKTRKTKCYVVHLLLCTHRSRRTTVITHVVGVCCCMALDQATEALQLHHRYPSNRARHHHGRPIKTWLCANKSQNTWKPLGIKRDSVFQKWCVLVSSIIHESFHFLWLIIATPQGVAVYPRMHWGRAGKHLSQLDLQLSAIDAQKLYFPQKKKSFLQQKSDCQKSYFSSLID